MERVTEEPTDEANCDTVQTQPSCSITVRPEKVTVGNIVPQPEPREITREESMNVSAFQTLLSSRKNNQSLAIT
jgi:hypothetical protein